MSRSFMHHGPCPMDSVELTSPPVEPLVWPSRDRLEMKYFQPAKWAKGPSSVVDTLSSEDLAAKAAEANLPLMVPEVADSLCTRPTDASRAVHETIRPEDGSLYSECKLQGVESVQRQLHVLSAPMPQHSPPHVVGVDAPWTPGIWTSNCARKAHMKHAEKWFRDAVTNPRALGALDLSRQHSDEQECEVEQHGPALRVISEEDRRNSSRRAGPAEEHIIRNPGLTQRGPCTRPDRPVSIFDLAERLYWRHEERKRKLRILAKRCKISLAEAQAYAGKEVSQTAQTWAQLDDEAETAEMVLRVYGKLAPPKAWKAPSPKKASPKATGKAKGKQSAATAAAIGDAAPATTTAEAPGEQTPSPGKRARKPSAKAQAVQTPSPSSSDVSSAVSPANGRRGAAGKPISPPRTPRRKATG